MTSVHWASVVGVLLMLEGCAREKASASSGSSTAQRSPVSWAAPVKVASGEAYRGPWQMNQSDFRWVDDATIALGSSGEAAVVWADQRRKDIFFQRYGRNGAPLLTRPTDVSRSPATFSWLPRVVRAEPDETRLFILWQEIVFSGGTHGGEIFFARSVDGGQSFDEPVNLSNSVAGDGKGRLDQDAWDNGSLDLARAPDGALYAAWTDYEGALWFCTATDSEARFSSPRRIAGSADAPARAPSIAAGREGVVHVSWSVGESASADIHHAGSRDAGLSFETRGVVFASEAHSDTPKIAFDARGTLHLAFAESESPEDSRYTIQYSRLRAGAARFDSPRLILGARVGDEVSRRSPQLSVAANGHVYVLAESSKVGARAYGLELAYSEDGGESFRDAVALRGIAGAELGESGSQQGQLSRKLAVNDAGAVAVVNSTFLPDKESHVWLLLGQTRAPSLP